MVNLANSSPSSKAQGEAQAKAQAKAQGEAQAKAQGKAQAGRAVPSCWLLLEDGTCYRGHGYGVDSVAKIGELCFTTGMSGYQESLTDPSFARQIIIFTFPHIGNVGANDEDMECTRPFALGAVLREKITRPSNWRAQCSFDTWLSANGLTAIAGVDTRLLTRRIRDEGAPRACLYKAHPRESINLDALFAELRAWPGLKDAELAKQVGCSEPRQWRDPVTTKHFLVTTKPFSDNAHRKPQVATRSSQKSTRKRNATTTAKSKIPYHPKIPYHVVAIDYGIKRAILRQLAQFGARVTTVPPTHGFEDIMALKPDGIFLSNGPGDPAATARYAVPIIRRLLATRLPFFAICLGHQLTCLALGFESEKMRLGHRGANHPVKTNWTPHLLSRVVITSQNHGFVIKKQHLEHADIELSTETSDSLFDQTIEGIRFRHKGDKTWNVSVQYHPEASPGPHDSRALFQDFDERIRLALDERLSEKLSENLSEKLSSENLSSTKNRGT